MAEQSEEAKQHASDQKIFQSFDSFDRDKFGYISVNDLKLALERCGVELSQDQTYWTIAMNDPENRGTINLAQFKAIIAEIKESENSSSVEDLLDAYVAMGGEADGGGCVDADKLIDTIKNEFEMTIDIEKLIEEIDEDGSGEIEFEEFQALLAGGNADDEEDEDDD